MIPTRIDLTNGSLDHTTDRGVSVASSAPAEPVVIARRVRRTRVSLAGGLVGLIGLVALTACSGGSVDASDSDTTPTFGDAPLEAVTTTTEPSACEPAAMAELGGELQSEDCYQARAAQARDSVRSKELSSMSSEELNTAVQSLCDAADAATDVYRFSTRAAALEELIGQPKWSTAAKAEVSSIADSECAESMAELRRMPRMAQPVLVTYRVETDAGVTASWVIAPNVIDEATSVGPWQSEVLVSTPLDLHVDATFDGGASRRCTISVGENVVNSAELPDGAKVPELRCSLSAAELEFGSVTSPGEHDESDN